MANRERFKKDFFLRSSHTEKSSAPLFKFEEVEEWWKVPSIPFCLCPVLNPLASLCQAITATL